MSSSVPPAESPQIVHLLLVDEDEAKIREVRQMLLLGKITNPLRVLGPREALIFLRHALPSQARRLILLAIDDHPTQSIKMMRALREDEELREIPVIALFSTAGDKERMHAVDLRADGYLSRASMRASAFMEVMASLKHYWSSVEPVAPAGTTGPTGPAGSSQSAPPAAPAGLRR